jgi:hypothetical protein
MICSGLTPFEAASTNKNQKKKRMEFSDNEVWNAYALILAVFRKYLTLANLDPN